MAGTKKIKVNAVLTTYEILLKDKVCRLSFFFKDSHRGSHVVACHVYVLDDEFEKSFHQMYRL